MAITVDIGVENERRLKAQAARRVVGPETLASELVVSGLQNGDHGREEVNLSKMDARSDGGETMTARKLLESGIVGMWKDRPETQDAPRFARMLRERAQNRRRS